MPKETRIDLSHLPPSSADEIRAMVRQAGLDLPEELMQQFIAAWPAYEAMVRRIGLKDPVNQLVTINFNAKPVRIIGVIKDALMDSPYKPVEPAVFGHNPFGFVVTYRLAKNAGTHTAIDKIGKMFGK